MFPQMTTPNVAKPDWRPTFVDYLYVSVTNVMAFSPTDTMPLARWAKAMMTVQAIGGAIHCRARNLKGGERFGLIVQPEIRSTFAVMGIATTELTPIEQTAFLTEYARALDSQWSRPILGDTLAHEVVGKIDYDFAGLGVQTSVVCHTALRAKMLDDRVRDFIERASRRRRGRPRRRAGQRFLPRRSATVGGLVQPSTSPESPRCATRCCPTVPAHTRCRCRWPTSTGRTRSRRIVRPCSSPTGCSPS